MELENNNNLQKILNDVYEVILQRKQTKPKGSYVASLFDKGLNSILKKVGEEANEVIIASKDAKREDIIHEVCDLLFHTLVVLAHHEIEPDKIFNELQKRFK